MWRSKRGQRHGFTLMEVAIAVLVVGVGVLALFALISSGMDASARAIADTHAAMLASGIFNGLRAMAATNAQAAAQNNNYSTWTNFWIGVSNAAPVWAPAPQAWVPPPWTNFLYAVSTNRPVLLVFENQSQRGLAGNLGIQNFVVTYWLSVRPKPTTDFPSTWSAMLWIWPGRRNFDIRNNEQWKKASSEALKFYTEFPCSGTL